MASPPHPGTYHPKMGSPPEPTSPRAIMLKKWPREDRRRLLHAVYRVGDIEKTMG
jgi:hypothetical protein